LLENACKHSGIGTDEKGFIEMEITVLKSKLIVISRNSVTGFEPGGTPETSGIGLNNIEKRLQLLFSDNYRLICHKADNIFQVEMQIPVLCRVAV